jgi:A/G-specific adenine glycosylase
MRVAEAEPTGPDESVGTVPRLVTTWFEAHHRDLPWRAPDAGAWAVTVSEFMLQQTPVSRVLPVYAAWLARWPSPAALAADEPGAAVRMWGRLGYPRRALRLHATACAIVRDHDGKVPAQYAALRALPGVGDYTAAAIASFAYGRRHVVLDTNVRRVLARVFTGAQFAADSVSAAERSLAESVLPADAAWAARWAAASMELGALVCTARNPQCERCPVANECAWDRAGQPVHEGPARRVQSYAGTDRQCRGRLLAVLRESPEPVGADELIAVWADAAQRDRSLTSLLTDGLAVAAGDGRYALP